MVFKYIRAVIGFVSLIPLSVILICPFLDFLDIFNVKSLKDFLNIKENV